MIEAGSFDELVAQNGRFAELARAQFMAGEAPRTVVPVTRPAIVAVGGV